MIFESLSYTQNSYFLCMSFSSFIFKNWLFSFSLSDLGAKNWSDLTILLKLWDQDSWPFFCLQHYYFCLFAFKKNCLLLFFKKIYFILYLLFYCGHTFWYFIILQNPCSLFQSFPLLISQLNFHWYLSSLLLFCCAIILLLSLWILRTEV